MKRILITLMTAALLAALAAPAYAAFTPSAESKAAPVIVTKDGTAGRILNSEDGQVVRDLSTEDLVITPIARKEMAPTVEVKDQMVDAQEQIQECESLDELTGQLRNALSAVKQTTTDSAIKSVRVEDLVVSDLFDVTYLLNGIVTPIRVGNRISFTIKTNLTKDDLFFVLHNIKDDVWEVVDDVVLADNGDLTITVDSLSPFAIVVDRVAHSSTNPPSGGDTPISPKTGETTNYVYLAGTVAMLVCAAFLCMKGIKRSEA